MDRGRVGFVPTSSSYSADDTADCGREVFQVAIKEIGAVQRAPAIPIFNDSRDSGLTARERVVAILRGLRNRAAIPPVEVVPTAEGSAHPFKLTNGTHRLYCSLAAGFSHVPAVIGFDIHAP